MSATRSSTTAMSWRGWRRSARSSCEELADVPDDGQPVVFSAHGVPKSVPAEAAARELLYLDATCPLVSKVHKQAMLHVKRGRHVLLIGHQGPSRGRSARWASSTPGTVTLIESEADVAAFEPADPDGARLRHADDAVGGRHRRRSSPRCRRKFPEHAGAVVGFDLLCHDQPPGGGEGGGARHATCFLIVGAPNSSNSHAPRRGRDARRRARLRAGAARDGHPWHLVSRRRDVLGMSAGASAPEIVVDEIIDAFRERFEVRVELVRTAEENEDFPVMRSLRDTPLLAADMAFVHGDGASAAVRREPLTWPSTPTSRSAALGLPRRLRSRRAAQLQGHRGRGRELELPPAHRGRHLHPDALREARGPRTTCRSSSG